MATAATRRKKSKDVQLTDDQMQNLRYISDNMTAEGLVVPSFVALPLVDAGVIETIDMVNGAENIDYLVQLTEKGVTMLSSVEVVAPEAAPEPEPVIEKPKTQNQGTAMFTIMKNVPMPAVTGRGRKSPKYDFDGMEVGDFFFVPATEEMPDPTKTMASTVAAANARYGEETGETKTVTVKVYERDADGKRVKDADGKFVVIGETEETRPVKTRTRQFSLRSFNFEGADGAGIWRTA